MTARESLVKRINTVNEEATFNSVYVHVSINGEDEPSVELCFQPGDIMFYDEETNALSFEKADDATHITIKGIRTVWYDDATGSYTLDTGFAGIEYTLFF